MKLKVVLHPAEEGGFWAEVPALPGCVSEGETVEEVLTNIREAAEGWLIVAAERVAAAARPMSWRSRCEIPVGAALLSRPRSPRLAVATGARESSYLRTTRKSDDSSAFLSMAIKTYSKRVRSLGCSKHLV